MGKVAFVSTLVLLTHHRMESREGHAILSAAGSYNAAMYALLRVYGDGGLRFLGGLHFLKDICFLCAGSTSARQ